MAVWTSILTTSAVVMGLSYTLATQRIFLPLRERCGGKETWLGYLVSCPYCCSHGFAFLLVPLTGAYGVHITPQWGLATRLLDWFLSSILVTVVAAFLRIVFFLVDEGQGLIRREQKEVEAETAVQRAVREKLAGEGPTADVH
jgi:hypothetical protein